MNYIRGSEREEMLLLPEALEDYIAPENPVRFIEAFVAQLDLQAAGAELTYRFSTNELGRAISYYETSACARCALKLKCTRNQGNRRITRMAGEEVQEAMAQRVAKNPQLMRRRKALIEHCFGTIKRSFGYDYFLCRGKEKVTTEINLTVLAYNLKRVCNLLGVQNLVAALS